MLGHPGRNRSERRIQRCRVTAAGLSKVRTTATLAANLRRVFSGIVAGNVKTDGIEAIRQNGLFEIRGDKDIMESLDALLGAFVSDNRMKLPGGKSYTPCYRVIT